MAFKGFRFPFIENGRVVMKSYSAGESRASDGKWTNGSSKVQAKGAETVSDKAHAATQSLSNPDSPAAKQSRQASEQVPRDGKKNDGRSGGPDATDKDHMRSANHHEDLAAVHDKVAASSSDSGAKKGHEDAAKLHRAAAFAHKKTAHQILDAKATPDF